jgi:hypothetical protein
MRPALTDRPRCCAVRVAQGDAIGSGQRRSDPCADGLRSRPNLVETGAAVDGPVVARSKRDHRLAATATADRGVELARGTDSPGALGDSPTGRASLGVVEQPLAGEEGLLTAREDELTRAVAAGEGAVLEHACLFLLLGADAPVCVAAPRASRSIGRRRQEGAHRPVRTGLGPGTHEGHNNRAVKHNVPPNLVTSGPICHDIRTIVRRWPGMASAGGPTARPTPSPFGRCWWTKRRSRTVRRSDDRCRIELGVKARTSPADIPDKRPVRPRRHHGRDARPALAPPR